MKESVKNVFQISEDSMSDLNTKNITDTFGQGGLESSLDEKLRLKTMDIKSAMLFTAKPVIMQSYGSINMDLLEFRAKLNTANTEDMKKMAVEEFMKSHENHGFYEVKLTETGAGIDIEDIDAMLRPLRSSMLSADICDIGEKDCIVGCIYFGEAGIVQKIANKFLAVKLMDMMDFRSQEKILGSLQHIMRTPKVLIR